jgi:hypothetical protein
MNNFQIRAFVRQLITEAKAEKDDKKANKKSAKNEDSRTAVQKDLDILRQSKPGIDPSTGKYDPARARQAALDKLNQDIKDKARSTFIPNTPKGRGIDLRQEGSKTVKSSGKLMDLKKEVAYLKEMSSQLQAMGLNEVEEVTEVEFSNLQKFVNELSKVKQSSADLKKKLDEEITATEAKIKAEKDKIKEMIGLISEPTVVDEAKMTKGEKKEKEKIVKGMKKNKAEFKKDYGKDAEKVMYATATKMAQKKK